MLLLMIFLVIYPTMYGNYLIFQLKESQLPSEVDFRGNLLSKTWLRLPYGYDYR